MFGPRMDCVARVAFERCCAENGGPRSPPSCPHCPESLGSSDSLENTAPRSPCGTAGRQPGRHNPSVVRTTPPLEAKPKRAHKGPRWGGILLSNKNRMMPSIHVIINAKGGAHGNNFQARLVRYALDRHRHIVQFNAGDSFSTLANLSSLKSRRHTNHEYV